MTAGWTDERVERLTVQWVAGVSAGNIARDLGHTTRSAVIGKVARLGLTRRDQIDYIAPSKVAVGSRDRSRPRIDVSVSLALAILKMLKGGVVLPEITGEVPGSAPRPFLTRKFSSECAWIVAGEGAEAVACCLPMVRGSYCDVHARAAFLPTGPAPQAPVQAVGRNTKRREFDPAQVSRWAA